MATKTQTHNVTPVASTSVMDFDSLLAEIKSGSAARNAARKGTRVSLYVKGTLQHEVDTLIKAMLTTDSESVTFDRDDMVGKYTVTRKGRDASPMLAKEWATVTKNALAAWHENADVYVTGVDGKNGTVTVLNIAAAQQATVSAIIGDITNVVDTIARTSDDSPRLTGLNERLDYLRREYQRVVAQ